MLRTQGGKRDPPRPKGEGYTGGSLLFHAVGVLLPKQTEARADRVAGLATLALAANKTQVASTFQELCPRHWVDKSQLFGE